jgi:hypothetical protein
MEKLAMEKIDKSSKVINNENDINKAEEATKGMKVQNKNVIIMQRNNLHCEKKTFCSDDVKKHVSLLRKFEFISLIIPMPQIAYHFF